MSTGSGTGTQDDTSRRTQGASRAERTARWLRTPLIVAALLAIPTIIGDEPSYGEAETGPLMRLFGRSLHALE
jgi:hypothetical protein